MNPWLTHNTAQLARERRAELRQDAAQILLAAAMIFLAGALALSVIRAAAITGANLPHTLEQAERLRAG
jgi:hypothetical protein